jgi:peptidoglycan/xylan/chitin deacetylase (PgdA/CDA1 family)
MGYSTLTVSEFLERMASADIGKSIVITFDDGYKDNMTEAAVLLKERGMKATFFVTTSYIDKSVKKAWTDGSDRKYMDWKDIIELVRMGFEIGSHMVEHVNLAIQNDEKLIFQFEGSKKRIADMTGHEPRVFSYPYGNVDERVVNVARKAGYVGGCSSFTGINGSNVSPYLLKRTEIDGYDTIKDFRAKLSGWYD